VLMVLMVLITEGAYDIARSTICLCAACRLDFCSA